MRCRYILRDGKTCSITNLACDVDRIDKCELATVSTHPFETTRTLVPTKRTFKTKGGERREECYYQLTIPKVWGDRLRIKDSPPKKREVRLLYDGIIKILPMNKRKDTQHE